MVCIEKTVYLLRNKHYVFKMLNSLNMYLDHVLCYTILPQ